MVFGPAAASTGCSTVLNVLRWSPPAAFGKQTNTLSGSDDRDRATYSWPCANTGEGKHVPTARKTYIGKYMHKGADMGIADGGGSGAGA